MGEALWCPGASVPHRESLIKNKEAGEEVFREREAGEGGGLGDRKSVV